MTPTSRYATCAGYEIHYMEWGVRDAPVVIAWHGLARTGRDMDELAAHLSARGYRVLCPDTVGRGLSQWASEPEREYCLAAYARLAREVVLQLGIEQCPWVGTSIQRNWPRAPGPRVVMRSAVSRSTRSDSAPRSSSTGTASAS